MSNDKLVQQPTVSREMFLQGGRDFPTCESYKEELDLSTVRKALERNRSTIEPNTLYLSWVELDALYRIVGMNKE